MALLDGKHPVDHLWVLVAGVLVFFMQAGFAMVETGFTRAKNSCNILMKNLLDFCVGSLMFWAIGYAFMFGSSSGLIGTTGFFLQGLESETDAAGNFIAWKPWTFTYWWFQVVFCATAATIVSGAVAERIQFRAYLIYTIFISGLIYPLFGHWTWGGGWLAQMGFIDFAGSTIVHSMGGWAGLAGAIMVGPRKGKFGPNGEVYPIAGHSMPLAALGVFILWFGWFGFNPGSTVAVSNGGIGEAVRIAVTTNLAAAAGAISAMLTIWSATGKPDTGLTLNGALAGLVAVTAGCANVSLWGAVIIGLIAGFVVVKSVFLFDRLRIDDPVGAVSVHGVCGALGTLLLVFFDASEKGAGKEPHFGVQLLGVATAFALSFGSMCLVFFALKKLGWLRASAEEEEAGLDLGEHGNEAYPEFYVKAES